MPPLNVNSRPQPAGARPPLLPITLLLLLLLPQLEQGQGMPLLCPSSSSSSAPGLPTPSSASLPRHQKALPCFPSVSDAKAAFKRLRPILASWESSAPASASTRHVEAEPQPSQAMTCPGTRRPRSGCGSAIAWRACIHWSQMA